ncbi:MAG TPA: MMPL family transporter [Thermoleophilaceae bacterium]|nr:MMPL family transporter [Thermoleophilaceae bacterium]
MQQAMDRLSGFLERRRRLVLLAWLVVLLAALPFAVRQTEDLTSGGFSIPGSGSEAVDEALAGFENAQDRQLAVVIALREGGDAAAVRGEIDRVADTTARLPHVELSERAAAAAKREAGAAPVTIVPLDVRGDANAVADLAVDLRAELEVGTGPRNGVEPYLVGQAALWAGMQDLSKEDLEAAEVTGFPIVLLILLAVFGSLAAAALPLALGFASVALTGAAIYFLSQTADMSVFVTNVASMIGIGVAVDYSLFVLARYREEIRAGMEPEDARRVALRTSGLAVAFSGLTVMISLAGLFLVEAQTIRSMAVGAIVVVAISVLAAVTLLPAMLRVLGHRAYARGRLAVILSIAARTWRPRRRGSTSPTRAPRPDFWSRWTSRVTRRPGVAAAVSAALLLVLAIPTLSLEWGDGALRQFPEGHETRVGAELAAQANGPGSAAPARVLAEFGSGRYSDTANESAVSAYAAALAADPEVASVAEPVPSGDGRSVLISAVPRHDPESPEARALIDRLREGAGSGEGLSRVAAISVGGSTAQVEDFKDAVSGSMWKILLFVAAFSYLVLLVLLRSVVLPLKAVVMNLLTVGAAYGVLVAIFQYGWIDGFLGFQSLGYINTMTPPFLLAIVFGLSMDYEVFLLTRIRERYDATGDTRRAVAEGLRASAKTITSAALIMVAVFSVFAGTGVPSVKEIGLGLAVAIALDATIVRLVLVPATMELLGRWNWWLPKPLARVLPRADFEASGRSGEALSPTPARS